MEGLLDNSEPSNYQLSIEKQFNQALPYYITIGMTPEQFWDGDVELVKAYRKAYEYKKQEWNIQAYLNGMYVYDALLRVSPIFHAFAKKGTKPMQYREQPIEIFTSEKEKQKTEIDKSRDMQLRMIEKFKKINRRFNKKEEGTPWQQAAQ